MLAARPGARGHLTPPSQLGAPNQCEGVPGVTSWFYTDELQPRRKYRAAKGPVLDDLLTAVGANRDDEAFTVLFDHFRPRVHAQMLRLGLAPFAAADVTQDVMETTWRKAHLFDRRKSAAATWVFRIAPNHRLDVGRPSRPTPHGERHVRAALDALPREQFKMVHLAFFEDLSHATIAARTNLPIGTVKSRLRLAVSRLRRVLQDAGVSEALQFD